MKNEDYGLPVIDEDTGKAVNYIFSRLFGAIPSLKHTVTDAGDLDRFRAEYSYALMRHQVKSIEVINSAIDRVIDEEFKFLPTAGEFAGICRREMGAVRRREVAELTYKKNKELEAADAKREAAVERLASRGVVAPKIADYCNLDDPKSFSGLKKYFEDMKNWDKEVKSAEAELFIGGDA